MTDLLITNGRVADGTGNPLRRANVAVDGGRIVGVGRLDGVAASRTIDADGRLVCPGFVDPHSHSDRTILVNPRADSTIRQGVTTEIVGNCGMTQAPISDISRGDMTGGLEYYGYTDEVDWETLGELMAKVHEKGLSPNFGWLIGHNAVRAAVGGDSNPATPAQIAAMREYVDEAMQAGALGLSTGLEFKPGAWATTEEIIELNKVVGSYGGIYASHVRNRDSQLRESTEEFIRIVREGGTRGEFSHLNVRHNSGAAPGAWQESVEMLAAAREEGLEILADTTPFLDGLGRMTGILPAWLLAQSTDDVIRDLRDPEVRERLRRDCDRYWRFIHKGEWHRVRLVASPTRPDLNGRSFTEIARMLGTDEWDAFFEILADAGESYGDLQMVGRLFTDDHMAEMISHPLFSLGVDCLSSSTEPPLGNLIRHPVSYAGHVHYLTHHVATQGTLRLEEAIRKMTSMPAAQFGLHDRGLLREGFAADISIIDLDRLDDVSTIEDPVRYVAGVDHVFVNGVQVVADGDHTGALPGVQVLAR